MFLQEGWTDVPGADENLVTCMDKGARVIGGGIRYDKDGPAQIRRVFELAQHYDADVDFHLDGGFDTTQFDYPQVCEITDRIGWQGRVAFGHGSKFSCLPVAGQVEVGKRLAASDVSLAVLPATDIFNAGRHMEHSVIRGVTDANTLIAQGANCTIATDKVLNAYTPYADCSLTRIVNLYANVVQRYGPTDLGVCFEMITARAARALRLPDYGIAIGNAADLVVWNEGSPAGVIETCALPLASFKRGQQIFSREQPALLRAQSSSKGLSQNNQSKIEVVAACGQQGARRVSPCSMNTKCPCEKGVAWQYPRRRLCTKRKIRPYLTAEQRRWRCAAATESGGLFCDSP
ncbi:MAG: cytosine deaminase [Gammaproteobacteria bacterium]